MKPAGILPQFDAQLPVRFISAHLYPLVLAASRAIESKMGDVTNHERVSKPIIVNAKLCKPLAFAVCHHHLAEDIRDGVKSLVSLRL